MIWRNNSKCIYSRYVRQRYMLPKWCDHMHIFDIMFDEFCRRTSIERKCVICTNDLVRDHSVTMKFYMYVHYIDKKQQAFYGCIIS